MRGPCKYFPNGSNTCNMFTLTHNWVNGAALYALILNIIHNILNLGMTNKQNLSLKIVE